MAPGEPGCVFHALVDSRMKTEDSWLLQATRLSNPLITEDKIQALYGASLLNKHTGGKLVRRE